MYDCVVSCGGRTEDEDLVLFNCGPLSWHDVCVRLGYNDLNIRGDCVAEVEKLSS